ncbi:hypothetical protein NSK_005488 [Nannochloropsis salina CCMP1776]|uniref:Uncharacterized protein n=1 Tax=Nannochloropsis salina CCMP1776 TaxID=1027361 RepID=A0A4D9CXI4_9STRA|nr:hypothetical protein NSK_005488 [Nannochloropsis salina CCMP1776]|eukprot:TFJ83204.1 hypothetical protein NSK_005488 [Nannochloropsis salina CCMP1776]
MPSSSSPSPPPSPPPSPQTFFYLLVNMGLKGNLSKALGHQQPRLVAEINSQTLAAEWGLEEGGEEGGKEGGKGGEGRGGKGREGREKREKAPVEAGGREGGRDGKEGETGRREGGREGGREGETGGEGCVLAASFNNVVMAVFRRTTIPPRSIRGRKKFLPRFRLRHLF